MSVAMWNYHSWPVDVSSIGQSRFICHIWCSSIQGIYSWFSGGSISQSRFICPGCSGFQGIYSRLTGGPSAKVGSSANFCVLVFKASILNSVGSGGPLAKVCLSAKFAYWYSRHLFSVTWGRGPSAKVGSPAKFGVLVFQASLLWDLGVHWSPRWLPNTSHNIYPMMHLGVDLPPDLGVDLLIAILDH